ncbi:MAG: membrane protein insertion efficiency factor YidD [Syntrophorhabdaceae bacterium]|nr:membrane protein insertion efficiency factor YidD [Syntrophorhabdaceae bacterium]
MERYKNRIRKFADLVRNALKTCIILLIDAYRLLLSPYIPGECRFHPTCSCYMKEAIEKKGILIGMLYGLKRILKCNPFFPGGYDPVR